MESTEAVEVEDELKTSDQAEPSVGNKASNRWAIGMILMVGLIVLTLVTTQLFLLSKLDDTRADLSAMQAQLVSIDDSVAGLSDDIADVSESVAGAPAVTGAGSSPVESPSASVPAGFLPRYDRNTQDQAIGLTMGSITGIDGYSEELVSFEPADGTKRIWMVWAHWCPFCQQEIPALTEWYPTVADQYETKLVTVSTNIDPGRGNPLETYLAEGQFPFPVLVDASNEMAIKMGVSAFPFWVVTDGNGEVLLRATGLLDVAQVQGLFEQLEDLGT